jgi:hypothetical protein
VLTEVWDCLSTWGRPLLIAHRAPCRLRPHHVPLRMAEMNSFSHSGKYGVSDTMGAALWTADTAFEFANAGAVGVNFHGATDAPGSTRAYDTPGEGPIIGCQIGTRQPIPHAK